MKIKEIINYIEKWAPPGVAWDKDNVGLQIGSSESDVTGIFLCLELTANALKEAIKKQCNLIVTHHPLIFRPIKKLDFSKSQNSKLIKDIIQNNISVFSAHTNLDFTKDGVSFELAKVLGLKNIKFLDNEKENKSKVVVFVPADSVKNVADSIFNAGGGIIGEYQKCSFQSAGIGTFEGSDNSNPVVGKKNLFEKTTEIRLEVLVNKWNLNKVISAIKDSHPYEEPAFDIYSVQNINVNYGAGAIGCLDKSLSADQFLSHICSKLKIKNLVYTNGKSSKIKNVAVCGGSGSELLDKAMALKADAFITADIKYHTYHDAEKNILLIDAGHYETEIFSLNAVKEKLELFIKKNNNDVKVIKSAGSTNPRKFYNYV
ncbi:MAG: Nif3-like dinuclear metal center hexameric protein [Melioribacteraceae bacterium]|nr:Nif3-like dinuclear metal center hexameric protein [Melioribacteraceae bacterium]